MIASNLTIWGAATYPRVRYVRQAHIDGLVQERRNSSALAMELRLSCTNLSRCPQVILDIHMWPLLLYKLL